MSTTLVVYESMYGNTQAIAEAIGAGLGAGARVVEVGELAGRPEAVDADLLVVGGPTHAFGMSRESTRADARKDAPDGAVLSGTGIREWLAELTLPAGTRVATFDTKVAKPNLPGSAAKAALKHLRRLGGRPVAAPRSFRVAGKTGLLDGETDAARAWGAELADAVR